MDIVPYAALYLDMPFSLLLKSLPQIFKTIDREVCVDIVKFTYYKHHLKSNFSRLKKLSLKIIKKKS